MLNKTKPDDVTIVEMSAKSTESDPEMQTVLKGKITRLNL